MQPNYYSKIAAAFEHSPIPFAVLSNDLHIVSTNAALSKRYGDVNDPALLSLLFRDVDKQTILNYLKSEKSYELIHDLPDQKGAHIYLTALFSEESGEFIGATAVLPNFSKAPCPFDADDQNDLQMAINRELRDRVAMMFSSIYALSRTSELDKSPKVCEFINSINQNCYQLLRVSDNLSKIMRLSEGNDYANFVLTDFVDYLKKLIAAVIHLDNKERVPIHFDLPDQIVPVKIDLERMEFAIVNILLNSIKYTREGNEITISLKCVDKNAILNISDKGAGIPKELLHLIGEPYYSYSHADRFEAGFGISLYIAKKFISAHGGSFVIQSVENEGTSVTISLPIDLDDSARDLLTLSAPAPFEPDSKFSQTKIQLSEVCYYPTM